MLPGKIGSIPFLSSFSKYQSHHLVECYATGINPLLISLLHPFRCLYLLPSRKSELENCRLCF